VWSRSTNTPTGCMHQVEEQEGKGNTAQGPGRADHPPTPPTHRVDRRKQKKDSGRVLKRSTRRWRSRPGTSPFFGVGWGGVGWGAVGWLVGQLVGWLVGLRWGGVGWGVPYQGVYDACVQRESASRALELVREGWPLLFVGRPAAASPPPSKTVPPKASICSPSIRW
jgi:hypothetical protein